MTAYGKYRVKIFTLHQENVRLRVENDASSPRRKEQYDKCRQDKCEMSADRDFRSVPILNVAEPQRLTSTFIVNSPHSGQHYPAAFLAQSRLTSDAIRRSEDCFVDELFSGAVQLGAPLLSANFPRAYLDVNREPLELDPKMFIETLPSHANSQSMRVGGGLGTIPRIVGDGMEIYRYRLPVSEALGRVETIYRPYHKRLRDLIIRTRTQFGVAYLLDCHSMPGSVRLGERGMKPDFIVGDRFGSSADREFTHAAFSILQSLGFAVSLNKPYAGGFITEHYGRPLQAIHALQIEVNRGLYMDEQTCRKSEQFSALKAAIDRFLEQLMPAFGAEPVRVPLAAE
jgi:N-formylglutamate amidohydrolase